MLLRHIEHNRVLHEKVVLLTFLSDRRPRVPFGEQRRFAAHRDGPVIYLVWEDGAAEFRIGGLMIDYLEHGVVQRRWERIQQESPGWH